MRLQVSGNENNHIDTEIHEWLAGLLGICHRGGTSGDPGNVSVSRVGLTPGRNFARFWAVLGPEMGKNEFLTPKAVRLHGTNSCHSSEHCFYISCAAYCSVLLHCRLATESRPRVCRS